MKLKNISMIGVISLFFTWSPFAAADDSSENVLQKETIELPCLFVNYGEENKMAAITLKMKQSANSSSWDISDYQILGEVDSNNKIIGKDGKIIEGKCSEYIRPEVALSY